MPTILTIFPKLYQPEKSQPKYSEDFSFSRPWPWAYFLNGPNAAASIALVWLAVRSNNAQLACMSNSRFADAAN